MMSRRGLRAILAAAVAALALDGALAQGRSGTPDVLYMAGSAWAAEEPETKLLLARTFMRIFCTDVRMEPERLVACIDQDGGDAVFDRALTCAARLSRS